MDIDDLLSHSAPPSADRTPEFREALRLLAADAESQSRAPRRPRRVALLIGASAAIVGLGTAGATAAGFIPSWVPWATSEGSTCTIQFVAKPTSTSAEPLQPAVRAAAVDEANRFLATFDLASIDEARAIREFQLQEDAAIASLPSVEQEPRIKDEQQPRLTGDDLAVNAMLLEVSQALDAQLASKGLPTGGRAVTAGMAWRCE